MAEAYGQLCKTEKRQRKTPGVLKKFSALAFATILVFYDEFTYYASLLFRRNDNVWIHNKNGTAIPGG